MFFYFIKENMIHLYIADIKGFSVLRNHFIGKALIEVDDGIEDIVFYHYVLTQFYFKIIKSEVLSKLKEIKIDDKKVFNVIINA